MPGPNLRTRSVDMDFGYGSAFGISTSDAYDRLLRLHDGQPYTRADEVEAAWQVVTPALSVWDAPWINFFPSMKLGEPAKRNSW